MRVIQRRSAQIIHLLYLVVQILLTYKRRLNILHDTKRKFLSISINPLLIACMLILLGVVLYAADGVGKKQIDLEHVTLKTSFLIGLSQALAIIPGVSRAGITISLALWLGMTREGAVRFSFLLSAPILLGQALIKAPKLIANPVIMDVGFFAGMAAAALFGLAAIYFLLRFIRSNTFLPFVIYRVALGILVLGFVFYRWDATIRIHPVLACF